MLNVQSFQSFDTASPPNQTATMQPWPWQSGIGRGSMTCRMRTAHQHGQASQLNTAKQEAGMMGRSAKRAHAWIGLYMLWRLPLELVAPCKQSRRAKPLSLKLWCPLSRNRNRKSTKTNLNCVGPRTPYAILGGRDGGGGVWPFRGTQARARWSRTCAESSSGLSTAADTRTHMAKKVDVTSLPTDPTEKKDLFLKSLIQSEHRRLLVYQVRAPGAAFDLNQNPEKRCLCSKDGVMSTLISSMGIMWLDGNDRFMASKELALVMGYPCTSASEAATGGATCSFSPSVPPPRNE